MTFSITIINDDNKKETIHNVERIIQDCCNGVFDIYIKDDGLAMMIPFDALMSVGGRFS